MSTGDETRVIDVNPVIPTKDMEEYAAAGVEASNGHLEAKPWGTKDFGSWDPNGAALVFYEDL